VQSRTTAENAPLIGKLTDFAEAGRFHQLVELRLRTPAHAVATVISRRYGRHHRWIPILAYGTSAAIGFSRLTLSAHYTSDVFVGAVFGYSISRFAVLHD
jgi:hypothetical protein